MEKARNVDIRQFYREDLGVHSEELLDKLEAVSQAVTLQKGEILNKKGERQTMLPFLIVLPWIVRAKRKPWALP